MLDKDPSLDIIDPKFLEAITEFSITQLSDHERPFSFLRINKYPVNNNKKVNDEKSVLAYNML